MKNMKKRLFGLVMAGVMMLSLAVSVSAANTSAANPFDYYADFTIEKNGCVVKEDGVYDRDGELVLQLHNGFTSDGFYLDRDFEVCYPQKSNGAPISSGGTEIFNGNVIVSTNSSGGEGVGFGPQFAFVADEPAFYAAWTGGACNFNISLNNLSTNSCVKYWKNIGIDNPVDGFMVYNPNRPNDQFGLRASGYDGYGEVGILVKTVPA